MSAVNTWYASLTPAQHQLLGDLVSQGVRFLLREGPGIDAAVREADRRWHAGLAAEAPKLQIGITVDVIEYALDQPSGVPIYTAEGGGS
jgi:hypothetical protein